MKKLLILGLLLPFCLCIQPVKAETTLQEEYLKGVYYSIRDQDGNVHTHQEAKFSFDGKTVYCLESKKDALPGDYDVIYGIPENFMNEEVQKLVEAYGYYGYDYPGHQEIGYYLAAQELIWEAVENVEVSWYTRNYEGGEQIDIETEKTIIKNLVTEENRKPSFIGETIKASVGEIIQLIDENQVISNYQTTEGIITGSQLILPASNNIGKQDIILTKNRYDYETTIFYQKEGSQAMSFLRLSYNNAVNLSIERTGGYIHIQKLVEQPVLVEGEYQYETFPKEGIEFELYAAEDIIGYCQQIYKKDERIMTLTTEKGGKIQTPVLPVGSYYIKEKTVLEDYYPNEKIYPIVINHNEVQELVITNEWKKGTLILTKTGPEKEVLPGTVFELYDQAGNLIITKITNEEGIVRFENIPFGEYMIKETKTDDRYILLTEPINITVNDRIKEVNIQNQKKPELPKTSSSKKKSNFFINCIVLALLTNVCKKHSY